MSDSAINSTVSVWESSFVISGLNIAKTVDCAIAAKTASSFDDVMVAKDIRYACSEPCQESIREDTAAHGLNRVVVAFCSPRLH